MRFKILGELAEDFLKRWELQPDGPSMRGQASLVLPVLRSDGTPAALKVQPVDDETVGEAIGLRVWDGDGAVRLLDEDPEAGALLLERLDETRPLIDVPDHMEATQTAAELLARLVAVPAPEGLRPALGNRWDDLVATGDVHRAIRRRFDLMVEVLDLDRQRAVGWTLGRLLQNGLWDIEDGETAIDENQTVIAEALKASN